MRSIDSGDPLATDARMHDLDSPVRVWDGDGDMAARVNIGAESKARRR